MFLMICNKFVIWRIFLQLHNIKKIYLLVKIIELHQNYRIRFLKYNDKLGCHMSLMLSISFYYWMANILMISSRSSVGNSSRMFLEISYVDILFRMFIEIFYFLLCKSKGWCFRSTFFFPSCFLFYDSLPFHFYIVLILIYVFQYVFVYFLNHIKL